MIALNESFECAEFHLEIFDPVADPEGVLRVPGHQPSWHGAAGAREIEVDSARRV